MILIATAATIGGLTAAFMGFLDSHEPWDWRKFGKSVLAALVAGLVFAYGQRFIGEVDTAALVMAFLSGAGVDVLTNRVVGAMR